MTAPRALVVGSGFVGTAIARRLAAGGTVAVRASRRPPAAAGAPGEPAWTALDATDRDACRRVVDAVRPDAVVLVHGPSDVTWCEAHPEEAVAAHTAATANLAAAAAGRRTVLISTDNVFDGAAPGYPEPAPTAPGNAYGRAKLAAERVLLATAADASVLRVSLVYGWEPPDAGKWLNYFASCAHRLRRGERVEAPDDHWTTPVLVDDVAEVTAAVLAGPAPELLHLGGPDRVSRAEWARLIATAVGAPTDLVVPVPKAAGRYACRPTNACLTSVHLGRIAATRGIRVRGVREGAEALLGAPHPG
ncbi:SDR family oxidoreductase [Allostreptomyces psammosilenae]|uniref:dTDP-4-dehydrorhamnose reductase n=1 Tax=Allostreptomyces psammosilenae TaxID=1892865 RepID=A0A853A1E2_9ACTN|nr:sugar nucleotide-binding protein [Allostreptomyces psammosilenae]NYI04218.1 dTDP-4-dehydrorhamnose reductase [Allostreptomyces psammosilenae]